MKVYTVKRKWVNKSDEVPVFVAVIVVAVAAEASVHNNFNWIIHYFRAIIKFNEIFLFHNMESIYMQ